MRQDADEARPDAGLLSALDAALGAAGLQCRGTFALTTGEARAGAATDGYAGGVLIGHAGGGFWPVFARWREANPALGDPLDTWSKAVIDPIASAYGGRAVYPSDRPYHPFQRWARRAEGLRPSPLGILIHPQYGLWHGYRGAILFPAGSLAHKLTGPKSAVHPCDVCLSKPCLTACPVAAVRPEAIDIGACRGHLATETGKAGCMAEGCAARNACPVGTAHRYSAEQIEFHMAAFAR